MAEVLTEKLAETAESVDTTAVGSATTETNENGEKAHLADGTLLEEMKKAVKQSAFNLFLVIESLVYLAHFLFLGVPVQKKKSWVLFRWCQPSLRQVQPIFFLGYLIFFIF